MSITEIKDANNVHLGLGVLGLATYPGASPVAYTDVGYIKSCSLEYSREFRDFESAGMLVKRLVFRDRLTLTANWAEFKIANLSKIFAPGLTYDNGTSGLIEFGGNKTITRYLVRFESPRDDGKVITVDLWKAAASGTQTLAFAEEEFITYPVEFAAEVDSSRASGRRYGRITIG